MTRDNRDWMVEMEVQERRTLKALISDAVGTAIEKLGAMAGERPVVINNLHVTINYASGGGAKVLAAGAVYNEAGVNHPVAYSKQDRRGY